MTNKKYGTNRGSGKIVDLVVILVDLLEILVDLLGIFWDLGGSFGILMDLLGILLDLLGILVDLLGILLDLLGILVDAGGSFGDLWRSLWIFWGNASSKECSSTQYYLAKNKRWKGSASCLLRVQSDTPVGSTYVLKVHDSIDF